ncbi:hypothetical protein GW17_00020469 [Ensete ventricosum]|nr:hypothetical protein GW17_00020469 [Ensete ventricosum]
MVASIVVGLGLITMVGVWICYSRLKFFPRANLVTWPAASGDDVMARMDLCDLKEGGLSTSLLELSSTGEAKQKSLVRACDVGMLVDQLSCTNEDLQVRVTKLEKRPLLAIEDAQVTMVVGLLG